MSPFVNVWRLPATFTLEDVEVDAEGDQTLCDACEHDGHTCLAFGCAHHHHLNKLVTRHQEIHKCADCHLPTSYAIGSYWLADDALWARIVDQPIALCPGCFHDRAHAKGVLIGWQAVESKA